MPDDIARDREKHRYTRCRKTREKENQSEEGKEFQDNSENRTREEWIDRNITKDENSDEQEALERDHQEDHKRESDKFPENETTSTDRFREDEVDGSSFDLASDHATTEKEDDGDSRELDE